MRISSRNIFALLIRQYEPMYVNFVDIKATRSGVFALT
uniref:Uncharacterized protein n=1 Tax=Parascaris equorum TaxID=6256 RepID=A0A914RII6_PAREQ